ncbi:MAG: lamin tail domain-containing protein [Bacteroidetes bacterium]|nr:MAG: lamin tail domain-containing protein [Bacteroidota bacterium]
MKHFQFALLVLFIAAFAACNNDNEETEETKNIVINEILPKNTQYGSDEDGEFDDWVELFNLANEDIDISGYYLTDSKKQPTKWKFPAGTVIAKNGFLIVWADGDSTHVSGLHTNYKLSADGENLVLLSPSQEVIDLVEYPATVLEQSYARVPNGIGKFKWSVPTFNKSNGDS